MESKEQAHIVKRGKHKSTHDWNEISKILDDNFIGHFVSMRGDIPVVLPRAYGRIGKTIYTHGAQKNGLMNANIKDNYASMTVTSLDGLILSKSAYHHSINYRSAVIFGSTRDVENDDEKIQGLKAISDHMLKQRWEDSRFPNENELKATKVMAIDIEYFVAKINDKTDPGDNKEDLDLAIWAGIIPTSTHYGNPQRAEYCSPEINLPEYMSELFEMQNT
ncbi:pyridoxamine 5'-phosphate oxidase family protein [Aureibacter tunicatorum]|uniref:Pyridoxamine 5'-phosphate oxidase family protein n=1 Tax=Aureibacter tunicatorum TaxID=866807 RepID=A0AAE3XR14_9BACT|nr:pyridoxamine 5'-phosphate oxidase family protein [Aureibacter tunicatorum]MDR6241562.1 hypothetical protein [Aureibacter tunicatorum]BDD07214.1 hypothetical protein AUTU_46970 [Aureibacter tunicatorum]